MSLNIGLKIETTSEMAPELSEFTAVAVWVQEKKRKRERCDVTTWIQSGFQNDLVKQKVRRTNTLT